MPIARYKLRNELSLADPELYRAADKDDPEDILEAVAMAGLAGLLRQLGDLSQFAAEIFHNLHEEVMVTAARGHGLMARVQQLEAEVPSLEKAFLSQTHHLSFFSYGGIGWHPNLRSEHNLICRGDLPRFVRDSYEECRGPPRLFLLDKFDVAGAGACLKRYTDPSFFKTESASSGLATVGVYREKKNHKIKKKGERLRNSKTPEVATTHTKLHQLLLEERIENTCTDPGRLVKLKSRQLNGSAIEAKTGKSYMERFLESPSLDHQVVCETSTSPNPVRLVPDDTSEAGIKILEISTVGPVKRSLGNERTYSWTDEEEAILKPSSEMHRKTDGDFVKKHEQSSVRVFNEQKKTENILCGYNSDDMTSEVDNYLDALANVESGLEIDEYIPKNSFLHIQKLTDSDEKKHQQRAPFLFSQSFGDSSTSDEISSFNRDITEDHAELQTRLSDSQSRTSFASDQNSSLKRDKNEEYSKQHAQVSDFHYIGKPSTSDVNSSFDKDIVCFSYFDSLSTVVENIPSEPMLLKSTKYNGSEIEDTSSNQLTHIEDVLMHDGTHDQEKEIYGTGQVSSGSYLTNSGRKLLSSDLVATSLTELHTGSQSEETPTGPIELQLRLEDEDTKYHVESIDAIPDATVSSEIYPLNKLTDCDQSVSCDAIFKILNDLELASEDECSYHSKIKGLQAESPNHNPSAVLVSREIGEEGQQPLCSSMQEVDLHSGTLLLDGQASKAEDGIEETQLNSGDLYPMVETPLLCSFTEQQSSDLIRDSPQDESYSVGVEVKCYNLQSDLKELSKMEYGAEISGSTCSLDADEDYSLLKDSCSADYSGQDYHVIGDGVASTELKSEDQSVSVDTAENDVRITTCPASGMISSTSRSLSNLQGLIPSISSCSHETKMESNDVELTKIAVDLNAEKMKNQLEPSSDSNVISSRMRNLTNLEESCSTFADPDEKQMEISEAVPRESLRELESQRIVHKVDAACANVELSLNRSVPCDNSETCNVIQGSSPKEQTEHSSSVKDMEMMLRLSKLDSHESKSISLWQSKLLRNGKDGLSSSSSYNQLESGTHLEKFLQLQVGQRDAGFPRYVESFYSNKLQSEQMQTSNHLEEDRNSYAASRPVPEIRLDQTSAFESLSQSDGQEVNCTKHVMNEPLPLLPDHFSSASKINFEKMPPMPPLPPMQWRTGRVQPASLPSHREVIEVSEASFQPIQPIKSKEQAQSSFPTSEREALQFQNPILPIMAVEGGRLQNTSGVLVGGHPVAIPLQLPIMLNEANGQYNYLVLERSQTHHPFLRLPVPVVSTSTPAQGHIVASEKEMVQSSNTSPPMPPIEHAISGQDPTSPQEESQPPSQLITEPSLEVKSLRQSTNNLEGEQRDPSISPTSPPSRENVQPNHNVLPSESEIGSTLTLDVSALASDFEREKLNGKPKDNLPRPQSPLIDPVAALDKSKLRKVTERVRPPIAPKVEERDSFLEQIRTKSFNLRPATPTRHRYHYQGPKTNLKVAAILEKANAIRQALAGSDEDDDMESWSDS